MTQAEMVLELRAMISREGMGRTLEALGRAVEGEGGRDDARMMPAYQRIVSHINAARKGAEIEGL